MGEYYSYKRISTDTERQNFNRQTKALERYATEHGIKYLLEFEEEQSAKSFENRPQFKILEKILQAGDTVVFKDISRFTRECENGMTKYMELLEKGINLVFIDNPTISSDYIRSMMSVADKQSNRIAKKSLKDTIELLILVELDRAEQERLTTVKRIKDGIAASNKKSGRKVGTLDKMSDELRTDIKAFLADRSIKHIDIMKKHGISRNTLKKYIEIVKEKEA